MTWVATAIAGSAVVGVYGANKAAQTQKEGAIASAETQKQMFDIQNAQQAPYREAGYSALSDILNMKPYLTHKFGQEDFQAGIDPSYNWRLQQGNLATTNLANRAGGAIGGNALTGLNDYAQGAASQEYGNAFNRYQTERGNIYNTLASIAGLGGTSLGQTGQLAGNTAANIGQAQMAGANAAAGGIVGASNAISGGMQNYGNMQYVSSLLKPQTGTPVPAGYGKTVPTPLNIDQA